ncbi:MAG: phosphatase PAP2 family protein [Chloroflexi bacterium]|nr:phosphatase PAP2 family protein [Chloroflexota bacterium]
MAADTAILLWLNSFVGHLPWLDRAVSLAVSDYFVPTTLALLMVGLWYSGRSEAQRERGQRAVADAAVGLGFANLAVTVLNHFYYRPRPFVEHELRLLFYQPPDSSFPSNPAAVGFALATGIALSHRRLGGVMLALAFLWTAGRVYAGVNFPSDVVAGGAIGALCSVLAHGFLPLLEPGPTIVLNAWRRIYLA